MDLYYIVVPKFKSVNEFRDYLENMFVNCNGIISVPLNYEYNKREIDNDENIKYFDNILHRHPSEFDNDLEKLINVYGDDVVNNDDNDELSDQIESFSEEGLNQYVKIDYIIDLLVKRYDDYCNSNSYYRRDRTDISLHELLSNDKLEYLKKCELIYNNEIDIVQVCSYDEDDYNEYNTEIDEFLMRTFCSGVFSNFWTYMDYYDSYN